MGIIKEGSYGLPRHLMPDMALKQVYPSLNIYSDYVNNLVIYEMDGKVIYSVHFLQNANCELYKKIEEAIEDHLKEKKGE